MNVTTTTTTTPYVNMKLIPTGSIVKPSLRKALLDHTDSNNNYNNNIKNSSSSVASGRSRTPFDALKSPGNMNNYFLTITIQTTILYVIYYVTLYYNMSSIITIC